MPIDVADRVIRVMSLSMAGVIHETATARLVASAALHTEQRCTLSTILHFASVSHDEAGEDRPIVRSAKVIVLRRVPHQRCSAKVSGLGYLQRTKNIPALGPVAKVATKELGCLAV